jgi:uncharacterized protein YndB with AHSA1/START domain
MEMTAKQSIRVETSVKAPIEKVWKYWNEPQHIIHWCCASDDWQVTHAENDLRPDGKFKTTMAAKDGSMSFDFEGTYSYIKQYKTIEYTILDGRKVIILFSVQGNEVKVTEIFEAETENAIEVQRGGWQAIVDNFKKYTEGN